MVNILREDKEKGYVIKIKGNQYVSEYMEGSKDDDWRPNWSWNSDKELPKYKVKFTKLVDKAKVFNSKSEAEEVAKSMGTMVYDSLGRRVFTDYSDKSKVVATDSELSKSNTDKGIYTDNKNKFGYLEKKIHEIRGFYFNNYKDYTTFFQKDKEELIKDLRDVLDSIK